MPDLIAPRLYSWGARALYVGPALGLSPHRNAVAVLAIGLDAPFGVADVAIDPASACRLCRMALIPPNTMHHLRETSGRMAFLYVDAASTDLAHIAALAAEHTPRAAYGFAVETALISLLNALSRNALAWDEAREALTALVLGAPKPIDPRVQRALRRLQTHVGPRIALDALAREAQLSPSRFLHLFKADTGVPLRRYKLWCAMAAAARAIGRGASLTDAALTAGFSSSAHFSAAHREMFGIEPSRVARAVFQAPAN